MKMNQPCYDIVSGASFTMSLVKKRQGSDAKKTYHQEKTHGVIEFGRIVACLAESLANLEPTGGQDDSEGDPETTVGGESSSTESVTDSHFPILQKSAY